MFIGRRVFTLLDPSYEQINTLVNELKEHISTKKIAEEYTINVFEYQMARGGTVNLGAAIEIEGPEQASIQELDTMMYAKTIEICERQQINGLQSRELEILQYP